MRKLACVVLAMCIAMCAGASMEAVAGEASPATVKLLTPERAVETARFMVDADSASPENPHGAVSLSPDGATWVARLVRGDVARNGVWMEMIAGSRASLETARRTRVVARLFSTGLGAGGGRAGANQDTSAWATPLRWLDRESVVFLWSDAQGRRQVMRVNVRTAEMRALTSHPTGLLNFDVGADGSLMYSANAAETPNRLEEQMRAGFVIEPHTDATSIMRGRVNEGSYIDRLWRTQWFVQRSDTEPLPMRIAEREFSPNQIERAWLSAGGRWTLVNAVAPTLPAQWDQYRDEGMRQRIENARADSHSMLGRLVHQAWVVDMERMTSRPLWSVPSNPETLHAAWSPDASAVMMAPSFLPAEDTDVRGPLGTAAVVVERTSGRYQVLPIDLRDQIVTDAQWVSRDQVRIDAGVRGSPKRVEFRRVGDAWRRVRSVMPAATVRLEIRQGIDTPPVLVAVDERSRQQMMVIDPNPALAAEFDLGRAERLEGEVEEGVRWQGMLFYPPSYDRTRRYPLVIQSVYGSAIRDEFTLYGFLEGYGLGPAFIPPYPGRLLAQHDVLVLQLNVTGKTGSGTPREAEIRARAFERAATTLIEGGQVDGARVGLIGFSRNGYWVEYTLTHSEFPFAAAIAVDHWQPDYVSQTLMGYGSSAVGVNGGPPFGEGLEKWLAASPAFNAEKVHTPLLQIEQGTSLVGVLLHWELFSRLRYLRRPVEMWVIPNAEVGVHNTQNPEQLIALQSRVIDWFRFWLSGEESGDAADDEQYRGWRELRELTSHSDADAKAVRGASSKAARASD